MDALTALHTRTSAPRLVEPAPEGPALEALFKAALRAPDHGLLRPWRFLVVRGEARQRLGELFARHIPSDSEEQRRKLAESPLRAPLLLVVIARAKEHPKVPFIEQFASAAAAAQNISLAAFAQGYASIWRTGEAAYNAGVKQALGLGAEDAIVGYLYLGTPTVTERPVPELNPADFVEEWGG